LYTKLFNIQYYVNFQAKKWMQNTMKQKEKGTILVDLKKKKKETRKKLVYFLWKNKSDFACKAMTICQAFRAQCE